MDPKAIREWLAMAAVCALVVVFTAGCVAAGGAFAAAKLTGDEGYRCGESPLANNQHRLGEYLRGEAEPDSVTSGTHPDEEYDIKEKSFVDVGENQVPVVKINSEKTGQTYWIKRGALCQ